MTGKSTIREFITDGDGSTIGEGAQRTTQSIHEYTWAGLRIVDTPGFGAFNGEEDARKARMMVEESDLVLFLMATSPAIQRPSFEEMSRLHDRDKPIIFALNVIHDLEKSDLLREEFLESPSDVVFAPSELQGHISRIETLASNELDMDPRALRICPIHAQAAFLSTQPEYSGHQEPLLQASRIHELLSMVSEDVKKNGVTRRRQTITGVTMRAASRLKDRLRKELSALEDQTAYLDQKIETLERRLEREKQDAVQTRIPSVVTQVFAPLRNRISTFVDDNIQRDDVEERWESEVERLDLREKVEEIQQDMCTRLRNVIRSFGEEVEVEAELTGLDLEPQSPSRRDPVNWKRGLGWTSAGSGALASIAGIAGSLSTANFWNPAGAILGGVAVVAGIGSWFSRSKNKKLQEAKTEAASQLRDSVGEMEDSVCDNLQEHYRKYLYPAYAEHTLNLLRTLKTTLREVDDEIERTESLRSHLESRLDNSSGG
jgi:hypothetical protein